MVKYFSPNFTRIIKVILGCCLISLTAHYLTAGSPQVVDSFWQHFLDENTTVSLDANEHHGDDNVLLPDLTVLHRPGDSILNFNSLALNPASNALSPQLPPPKLNHHS